MTKSSHPIRYLIAFLPILFSLMIVSATTGQDNSRTRELEEEIARLQAELEVLRRQSPSRIPVDGNREEGSLFQLNAHPGTGLAIPSAVQERTQPQRGNLRSDGVVDSNGSVDSNHVVDPAANFAPELTAPLNSVPSVAETLDSPLSDAPLSTAPPTQTPLMFAPQPANVLQSGIIVAPPNGPFVIVPGCPYEGCIYGSQPIWIYDASWLSAQPRFRDTGYFSADDRYRHDARRLYRWDDDDDFERD